MYVGKSDCLWVCCVALPCCLFDLACFFLPSFSSVIKTCVCVHVCIWTHYVVPMCMYMYIHVHVVFLVFRVSGRLYSSANYKRFHFCWYVPVEHTIYAYTCTVRPYIYMQLRKQSSIRVVSSYKESRTNMLIYGYILQPYKVQSVYNNSIACYVRN